jgi:hypothetical protein
MTYQDIIALVGNELRDVEAWPDDATKLQEQIDRIYDNLKVLAAGVPIQMLTPEVGKSEELTPTNSDGRGYYEADIPADVFSSRPDLGVRHVDVFNSNLSMRLRIFGEEFLSVVAIKQLSGSSVFSGDIRIGIDERAGKVFASNLQQDTKLQFYYIPAPQKPTTEQVGESGFVPIKKLMVPTLIQMVAAHVSGVTIRDPEAMQVHGALARTYSNQ